MNLIGTALAANIQKGSLNFLPSITPLTGENDLQTKILAGVNATLWFAGALAVIYLIYGGILYITAGGDAEKATKGRTALINAIIGVIVIILAISIVYYLGSVFGAEVKQ